MKTDKKVSIIIPAFNEEKYLYSALQSVERQTFAPSNLEVIVVDNASTDRTAEVFHAFFKKKSISHLIVEEPILSPGRARNTGATRARGEVFLFLDADSKLSPQTVQCVYDGYKKGLLMGIIRIKADSSDKMANLFFDLIHFGKKLFHIACHLGYCERNLFFEVGGFDPEIVHAEDLKFFTKVKKTLRKRGKDWGVIEDASIFTSTRRMSRYPFKLGYLITLLEWALCGLLSFNRRRYTPYR
jgi:glycosyltransferase involved in cell wall biosynthesis